MMFGRGLQNVCNFGQYSNFGNNGCYGNRGYVGNGGFGFLQYGFDLLIILGVVLLVVALVYYFTHRNKKMEHNFDEASEILKMKYVQGDITEEEYLRRKDLLSKN